MAKKKVTAPVVDSSVVTAVEAAVSVNTEVLEAAEEALAATTEALEVVESVQAAVAETVEVSKMQIARDIFNEMNAKGTLVRKDFIARFIAETGASKPCANTYHQNLRKAAGLVATKATTDEVTTDTTASA